MRSDARALRRADAGDRPFLEEMLIEAAYWRPEVVRPERVEALAAPKLAKLLTHWGERDGDTGLIALGPSGLAIGAAWYRFWTDADHSYGYVDAATPELGIAVRADWRGRGVGRRLMEGLVIEARRQHVGAISLSVERDNPARHLYERMGFEIAGDEGNAWTMLLKILNVLK